MKPGYLQISWSMANLRIRVSELAGLTLIWTRTQARARWRDEMIGDALHVGFAIESEDTITARGREIGADAAQVWIPGKEMDLVMGGANLTLDLAVEGRLLEELGWSMEGDPIKRVSRREPGRLIRTCQRATQGNRMKFT